MKASTKNVRRVRVWTYDQARKGIPYISSVMRSLREHYLESRSQRRTAEQLASKPGRPTRADLIVHADAIHQAAAAEGRFNDSLEELAALDVYCTDPLRGEALIPFVHAEKLAWYIFDLFDPTDPLRQWRYHDDPLETRRPIAETQDESLKCFTV